MNEGGKDRVDQRERERERERERKKETERPISGWSTFMSRLLQGRCKTCLQQDYRSSGRLSIS